MSIKHYNPDQVDHIVGGFTLTGFAEDKMSSFEIQNEVFTLVHGVDGGFTRSLQPGQWAKWTISLMSSSKANDFLSALHAADLLAPGAGVVPCGLIDRNGTTAMASVECYVEKIPPINKSNKAEAVEWSIVVVNPKVFLGGT